MAYVEDVFDAAMGIMDELAAGGQALTPDTEEYAQRTPAIINALVSELKILTGEREEWLPVESLEERVPVGDTSVRIGGQPAHRREPVGGELLPAALRGAAGLVSGAGAGVKRGYRQFVRRY